MFFWIFTQKKSFSSTANSYAKFSSSSSFLFSPLCSSSFPTKRLFRWPPPANLADDLLNSLRRFHVFQNAFQFLYRKNPFVTNSMRSITATSHLLLFLLHCSLFCREQFVFTKQTKRWGITCFDTAETEIWGLMRGYGSRRDPCSIVWIFHVDQNGQLTRQNLFFFSLE